MKVVAMLGRWTSWILFSLLFVASFISCSSGQPSSSMDRTSLLPRFEPAPCTFNKVDEAWASANGVECGWLHVEESRGSGDGRTIRLWTAVARATGPVAVQDPLLYIHGGPGIATVDARFPAISEHPTWPLLRTTRDIVFFDQRGTGRSEPEFCQELNDAMDAIAMDDPPAREALERKVAAFATCRQKLLQSGVNFASYNSRATADDAEDLRRTLGYPTWNVYGVSYGTWVALEMLRTHESTIRSVILDSPYPPNSPFWPEESIHPTGKAYEVVERACEADPVCAERFPSIRETLARAVKRLDAQPIPREGGRITGGAFTSALWVLLVRGATVAYVPLVIEAAADGNDDLIRRFVALFGGSGGFGAYSYGQAMAVTCHESLAGGSEPAVREAMRRYPFLVSSNALAETQDRICDVWQPHRADAATFAPVASRKPVLLFAGEFDPATPPEDAYQAARLLPGSTIVNVRGASHAPLHSDPCTRAIAQSFLNTPEKRPALDCLESRAPFRFATEGLEAFLESQVE